MRDEVGQQRDRPVGRGVRRPEVTDQGGEVAHRRRRLELQPHHRRGQADGSQAGKHGDPDTGPDEADGRVVVLGLQGKPWAEAHGGARGDDQPVADRAGVVVADPALATQVGERDRAAPGERVRPGHDRHELVLGEVRAPVPGRHGAVRRLDDEVDVRLGSPLLDLVEHQLEHEVGELPGQDLDERRHPGGAGRGEVADGEPPGTALAQVGDELVGPAPLAHHLVGLRVEHQRSLRRHDPTADAVEQGETGLPLEGRQVLADGRRREAQVVRGRLHRAARDDGAEDPDAVEVEHPLTIQCGLMTS